MKKWWASGIWKENKLPEVQDIKSNPYEKFTAFPLYLFNNESILFFFNCELFFIFLLKMRKMKKSPNQM